MPKRAQSDYQNRIDFVRSLLTVRCVTSVIKAAVRKRFGVTDHATVLRYMARAREQILADVGRGRELLRAESQAFYESVVADQLAVYKDKIKAQERIDKLLGLEAPTKLQHGNDPDNPLPTPILRVVQSVPDSNPNPNRNGHSDSHQPV